MRAKKVCIYCRVLKTAAEYHQHAYTKRDGTTGIRLNSGCRDCHNARVSRRRVSFPEKYKAQQQAYRLANADKVREAHRRYMKANPEKVREWTLRSQYGITSQQYDEMLSEQGGVCRVCREPPAMVGRKSRLHVDHCHDTGRVRGLLCHSCNVALGLLKDDKARVSALLAYLNG